MDASEIAGSGRQTPKAGLGGKREMVGQARVPVKFVGKNSPPIGAFLVN